MVNCFHISALAASAAIAISAVSAHPGEHHDHAQIKRELDMHQMYARMGARSLQQCAGSPGAILRKERAIARRAALAETLRAKRGIATENKSFLHRRDEASLEEFMAINHNKTGISSQDPSDLFSSNASCITAPEVTIGPYFVGGELIRSDVTDGQAGVPLHLEIELIDIATCKPVSAAMLVDIWHCNATGVYSGVSGEGGLDTTFNRGVQESDSDGVVQFDSTFPGHYNGRATHIHMQMSDGSTVLENSTYSGGVVRHIGQLFFDESLRSQVEAVEPYSTNTQEVTQNADDNIAQGASDNAFDPFVEYVYLGDSIQDGLLAWISIGVDTSANYTSQGTPAAFYREGGGVANPDAQSGPPGGGAGGPPGNGTRGPPPGASGTASRSSTARVSGSATPSVSAAGASASSSMGTKVKRTPGKWVRKMMRGRLPMA